MRGPHGFPCVLCCVVRATSLTLPTGMLPWWRPSRVGSPACRARPAPPASTPSPLRHPSLTTEATHGVDLLSSGLFLLLSGTARVVLDQEIPFLDSETRRVPRYRLDGVCGHHGLKDPHADKTKDCFIRRISCFAVPPVLI